MPLSAHDAADHTSNQESEPVIVSAHEDAASLPPNFIARTVVSGLTLPTDMAILPSGDFFVTEKGVGSAEFSSAQLRLVRQGVLQPQPVLTLSVNSLEDSGLLSVVLDPKFDSNHYFYLWYSTGESALNWAGKSYNRLSRFVFDPVSGTAALASETIILDQVTWSAIHNGGGLAFDDDGTLLITTGDAGSSPNFPKTHLAQSLKSLNGKVLRIRPRAEGGYDVPVDNPFVGSTDGTRTEIYAYGLRNPFRISHRAKNHQFYLADVGQDTWEEVDLLTPGANYGWPYREGKCAIYEREPNCTPNPGQYTDPLLVYVHPNGSGAGITAMAFYEGTIWPAQYRDRLFFADFNSAWIGTFNLNTPEQGFTKFATDMTALVDMEATAEGIYGVSIYDQSIKFIYYDEEDNHPPTATWQTTDTIGKAPLTVQFTASAQDADNDDLTYAWDFGDGAKMTTPQPTASHVYTQDGNYLATLQVVDEDDARSEILSQLIQVYSGEIATIVPENLVEPGRILYHGGDSIRFSAARMEGTTGLDPAAPYAWTILLHHNEHAHVLVAQYVSNDVTLDVPTHTHALGAPLWYEVQLSMRTVSGQVLQIIYALQPETTTIQLQSWPGQTVLRLNQQQKFSTDYTTVIVGQEYTLEAPENLIYNSHIGVFKNWVVADSWPEANIAGGTEIIAERVYTLIASAEPKSYIAFYVYTGIANLNFLPSVIR
jgi:glucose/arabinose dehydrogenase